MAKIKLSTMGGVPRFVHNGLNVTDGWEEIETDDLSDESRTALAEYTGRFVRVHDQDQDAFRSYLAQHGYEYKDGQVTDTRSADEREQERATAEAQRAAKGTSPGRPNPPRDDTGPAAVGSFQAPPVDEQ